MPRATEEVEVKLPFASVRDARERLERLGARIADERCFEENVIFDRERERLADAGLLLRLRRFGDRAWLTLKAPVAGRHRHKVREEHETLVEHADAVVQILERLGFAPVWRYQKYRTRYEHEGLSICLDETPIGCFVELEGPGQAIDRTARTLGFGVEQYVLDSYLELYEQDRLARGAVRRDMVFDQGSNRSEVPAR
jgi:adenylate cyclase class 2